MLKHLMRQLFIFIVEAEKIYKMLSERKKERLQGVTKQALLWNQKIPLEGPVVSLIGKCTALYMEKNAKIQKLIKDMNYCQLIVPF